MDNFEVKSDELTDSGGTITFKGWDIKNPEDVILEELDEYYDYEQEITGLEIIKKKEHAYAHPRFYEEQDANDEGYAYWIIYEDNWKKGLGKCTTFTIKYILREKDEVVEKIESSHFIK